MDNPQKKLKLIPGKKKQPKTYGFYCPKCDMQSAYSSDINPPMCIRCGYLFDVKFPKNK
jgi:rubredoxin